MKKTVVIRDLDGDDHTFVGVSKVVRGAETTILSSEGLEIQFYNAYIVYIAVKDEVTE